MRSAIRIGLVLSLLFAGLTQARAQEPKPIEIWPGKPPGDAVELEPERDMTGPGDGKPAGRRVTRIGNVSTPTITVYRPPADKANGTSVVICPGGGHRILAWDHEGTEVAEWLNSIGVTAVLLKYRVPFRNPDKKWEAAVQDAQRAVSLTRSHAEEWGLNPDRIGILGFSAGGQTAGYTCVLHRDRQYQKVDDVDDVSCRPDFAVLVYPAWLIKDNNTELADDVVVDDQTPPMFFAHAWDDPIRVENSLLMAAALKQAGVKCDLHVYANGGHGFGLRPTDEPCSKWPLACEQWMQRNGWLTVEAGK
jgi:acetyl esterase/lipase